MKAVIFGSGLSGLFAAWACHEKGIDYVVYTNRVEKPKVRGFMYLHHHCGLPVRSALLTQVVVPEGVDPEKASKFYSNLVYKNPETPNSLKYAYNEPIVTIWNMTQAVNHIWELIRSRVKLRTIRDLDEVISITGKEAEIGFSTIPLPKLDREGLYYFVDSYVTVALKPEAKENIVYYNGGLVGESAYRWGVINGQRFSESREKPGVTVHKVVFANYMPHVPDNVMLVGRYGAWDKSQMAHIVYEKVKKALES